MNQSVSILERFHHRGFPYTIQGSTIVVGAKIDVLLEQNKGLSDEDKGRVKELSGRLDNPSKYAQYLIRYYEEKDIVELINEFEKKFKRFDQKDINTYDIPELRDVLRLASKTKTEIKKEGTEKVFENDKAVVLKINTKEASCYYGAGTKWCISARENNLFNMHHGEHNIYFILSKNLPENDSLYKVAVLVDFDNKKIYYDSLDTVIKPSKIKQFNIPISVFKKISIQELVSRYDKEFKSELDGNVYKDEYYLPDFLVKNGEVVYDFSNIIFEDGFSALKKNIRTFKNFPQKAGHLNIKNNRITSLEGLPEDIIALYISHNKIKSLKGLPKNIQDLHISHNRISSLEGLPRKLSGLNISNNPGKFTEEEVRAVCDVYYLVV